MYKDKIIELCIFHIDEKDNRIGNLQAELITANDGINDLNDVVKDLQAENVELKSDNKKRLNEIIDLQADNKRLMEQVSSNSGNSSSTHTHTIKKEIAEYMDHNPKSMGARMFLLPRDQFAHGEYNHTIYWDDGME